MRCKASYCWASLILLALSTAAFAAPIPSRATAPQSSVETTPDPSGFLASLDPARMKPATTCSELTCFQIIGYCRNSCFARGGRGCGPINDCDDPCTYICDCLNIYSGDPC